MEPLRPFQLEAIEILQKPGHLLCISPTGSGKSRIYEALIRDQGYRALIVSPLAALARQQIEGLQRSGIHASRSKAGQVRVLAPEALRIASVDRALRSWRPELLVVDECHCVWDWGDHFRPAFACLPELPVQLGIDRSLWLTATLPTEEREELRRRLPAPFQERGDFDLPPRLRIQSERVPWVDRPQRLVTWLRDRPDPGLIYVLTRSSAERLRAFLQRIGLGKSTVAYHAGLGQEERLAIEKQIEQNEVRVVVATSAFGMGMNYPQFRWTLLWQAPPSLLALTQAIGRGARDPSLESDALLFWDFDDFRLLDWMTQSSPRRRAALLAVRAYLMTSEDRCFRSSLKQHFSMN